MNNEQTRKVNRTLTFSLLRSWWYVKKNFK